MFCQNRIQCIFFLWPMLNRWLSFSLRRKITKFSTPQTQHTHNSCILGLLLHARQTWAKETIYIKNMTLEESSNAGGSSWAPKGSLHHLHNWSHTSANIVKNAVVTVFPNFPSDRKWSVLRPKWSVLRPLRRSLSEPFISPSWERINILLWWEYANQIYEKQWSTHDISI